MTAVLVLGADSLVGSHFATVTRHEVVAAGRKDPRPQVPSVREFRAVDLAHPERVEAWARAAPEPVIVNFAAATDVDGTERERPTDGHDPAGSVAWRVNALAVEALARASRASGKYLVTISTDFVFDGRDGPYAESRAPSDSSAAVSWYGFTKGEGERRARSADSSAAILRIAYPYRAAYPDKLDFARKMIAQRREGRLPPLFSDQTITPTWVPDVSRSVERLIDRRPSGAFHAASPLTTTPLEFGTELFRRVEGHFPDLARGSLEEFLRRPGATPRPLRGGLACARLPALGVPLTSWRDGIEAFVRDGGAS